MGYKCGNCGIDFPTKKEQVEHMVNVHNSPFLEGEEREKKMSKTFLVKKGVKQVDIDNLYSEE